MGEGGRRGKNPRGGRLIQLWSGVVGEGVGEGGGRAEARRFI